MGLKWAYKWDVVPNLADYFEVKKFGSNISLPYSERPLYTDENSIVLMSGLIPDLFSKSFIKSNWIVGNMNDDVLIFTAKLGPNFSRLNLNW